MIAVIFEVWPDPKKGQTYFDLAAALRKDVEKVDGFISVERFESLTNKGKYLSLSIWRHRAAVEAWYRHAQHGEAQAAGRKGVFRDYRIRVAEVFRDYDMKNGRPPV
jgi:heme-degrading monooxygenase HmoA